MKIVGVSVLGLLGCFSLAFFGLLSNSSQTIWCLLQGRSVVSRKPVLPDIEPTVASIPCSSLPEEHIDRTETESPPSLKLQRKLDHLESGRNTLMAVDGYTGTFQKQEVVNGVLLDEQTIAIKCRHRPFSVYLVWLTGDVGREVLYIEGQNNGNMIAHDGGWKSRIPALTLPVDCSLAMRDARYPVTTAGVVGLIDIMRGVHEQDLLKSNVEACEIDEHRQFDGRPCTMFTTRYRSRSDSPVYRKSVTLIDHEWQIPVHTRHFEWPVTSATCSEEQLDESTLIECYSFTELKLNCELTDDDFDRKNSEYRFR